MPVHSFDVFDTLLTRRVGDPGRVHDLLAERLASAGEIPTAAAVFAASRVRYERRLIRTHGRHPGLGEIYDAVAWALGAEPTQVATWVAAEEQLERELCLALPGASDLVAAARRSSTRVIFVSDTPHREEFLRELLVTTGVARGDEAVFSSSERGVSKSSGRMFALVRERVGANDQFLHTGDNIRSDVTAARAEGWSSELAPAGRLNRYENSLETWASRTEHLSSWMAGSSRIARLEAADRELPPAIVDVGAGVLAPTLISYALWATAQARRLGVKRLYFVAREGEVMLAAARHVVGAIAPDLELRYLYGSRRTWCFGACATSDELLAHWLLPRGRTTPRTLLARVSLTPEEAFAVEGQGWAYPGGADRVLSTSESAAIAQALTSPPLLGMVRERAAGVAERSTAYLRQEGLFDGVPSALVDGGWEGSLSAALDELVSQEGGQSVRHFLIGRTRLKPGSHLPAPGEVLPWLFDQRNNPGALTDLPSPKLLIEMLCAGTEGRTIDYAITGGTVQPVLESQRNELVLSWGLASLQEVAVRVADLVSSHLTPSNAAVDMTGAVWDLLVEFWTRPTEAEAAAWSTFPWEGDGSNRFTRIAEPINTREVMRRAMAGDRTLHRPNAWRAGTVALSSQPWRLVLQTRERQQSLKGKWRRLPGRLWSRAARHQRSQRPGADNHGH